MLFINVVLEGLYMLKNFIDLIIVLILSLVTSELSCADGVKKLFRAIDVKPEEVKERGGFIPIGLDPEHPERLPTNINLWAHTHSATGAERLRSGFVSTTSLQSVAIRWVIEHLNENGYVYHISATPNFVDVNGTLRDYSPFPKEAEYAALGRVHW